MTPYYSREGITIFWGDCLDIMSKLVPGSIVTDPPYPDYLTKEYRQTPIDFLNNFDCRQIVFWSAKVPFPLSYTSIHIWDKKTGAGSEYERIFERNGQKSFKVFRHYLINSTVAANYTKDIYTGHKSQKPTALMIDIIKKLIKSGPIVDPFMGSGSTLEAGYKLGFDVIGIETKKKFIDMAINRLDRLPLRMNKPMSKPTQAALI